MKTVVITGSSSGIGFEFAKQYASAGFKVYAICRKTSPELSSLDVNIIDDIELTSQDLEKKLLEKLSGVKIDILLNNAGIFLEETLQNLNVESIRKQFEVNTIAPLRVTHALMLQINEGGKVGIVSSRMGSIEDNTSGGYYGYRSSKAAVNMFGKSLALDLAPRKISVALLHPGYVKTKMTGHQGEITADTSAKGLIECMTKLDLKNSGQFWHTNGQNLPW